MQNRSDVSVVIPAFNSRFIEETVASVYDQTVTPVQVIVVNDGSTDDTEARLRQLARHLPSSFIWSTKPNGGGASARNVGLRFATGKYVAFLDHDDLWHPTKLERQLEQLDSDPTIALSFTGYEYTYRGYRETPGRVNRPPPVLYHTAWESHPETVMEQLLFGRCPIVSLSTVMVRRAALEEVTPFHEQFMVVSDVLMYLELTVRRMRLDYLPDALTVYRWHGENLIRDIGKLWEESCAMYDWFFDAYFEELPAQICKRAATFSADWHLRTAIDAVRHGDKARARRHILVAAKKRPLSVRPGWVRMLGIGPPPVGPWP